MHPKLFAVDGIVIYSFGLFLALGIIFAGVLVAVLARRQRLSTRGLFDNILFVIFGAVIGARCAYILAHLEQFRAPLGTWMSIFALWQGGLIFYGGLLGGALAAWVAFRQDNKHIVRWFDILTLASLVGIAFGQSGCMLGGCAVGVDSSSAIAIDGKVPVQLFEALYAAVLFVVGITLYIKKPLWRKSGRIVISGSLLYVAGRLILDFFRPKTLTWGGVSLAVLSDVALLVILASIITYIALRKKHYHAIEG